jgi:ethanolamine utilization protein EutQ (cupin superfamily)
MPSVTDNLSKIRQEIVTKIQELYRDEKLRKQYLTDLIKKKRE